MLLRILGGDHALIQAGCGSAAFNASRATASMRQRSARATRRAILAAIRAAIPKRACRVPQELRRYLPLRRLSVRPCRHPPRRVELEQQTQTDLRWIREPFLFDDTDHGFVVVHGHTISTEVEERAKPDRDRHRRLPDRHLDRAGDRRQRASISRHATSRAQLRCKSQRIEFGTI